MSALPRDAPAWYLYVPILITVLRRGYGVIDFRRDLLSGLTVAMVAPPLAMALAMRAILAQMGVRPDGIHLRFADNFGDPVAMASAD